MSQENVEVVRRTLDAFNRQDIRALAELSDEDLEFVTVLAVVDAGGGTYRGPQLWADYFADRRGTWEEWGVEDLRVFDADGDRVAAVFRLVGKGKTSGVTVARAVGVAYTLRNGKLWRMRSYLDPAEALEAVGLRE